MATALQHLPTNPNAVAARIEADAELLPDVEHLRLLYRLSDRHSGGYGWDKLYAGLRHIAQDMAEDLGRDSADDILHEPRFGGAA